MSLNDQMGMKSAFGTSFLYFSRYENSRFYFAISNLDPWEYP